MMASQSDFSDNERLRYSRHFVMPEVGIEGQRKLKQARVLCVGAGGLGSPVAIYLAAAGVGTLGIVDSDIVELSNLHRQVLHTTNDVGRSKIESAKDHLGALNPEIEIRTHAARLTSENAAGILAEYDLVVDGTDNFASRYLISDACVLAGIPNAYGSIFRFDGQVSLFCTPGGPCYRCLYPDPPQAGSVPNCEEAGVFGVLPGIIGTLQATETIKWILGVGDSLAGRLLLFDALRMEMRVVRVPRSPGCPACGDEPTIRELIDYEELCGATPMTERGNNEITVTELKDRLDRNDDIVVLDIREDQERQVSRIPDQLFIPMGELRDRLDELDKEKEIIVYCRTGKRSAMVTTFLQREGYNATNLTGGVNEWVDQVDPSQKKY